MAEFQEVMRQWVRVRKATASSTEENVLSVYPLEVYDDAMIEHIEKNVMAWAAEHPEPVYPTWAEWLNSTGLTKHDTGQFCVHMPNQYSYEVKEVDILNEVAYKPIPADIAEKLGLQPKEGV